MYHLFIPQVIKYKKSHYYAACMYMTVCALATYNIYERILALAIYFTVILCQYVGRNIL